MPSAKLITYKIINALHRCQLKISVLFIVLVLCSSTRSFSQDNSPYSRYGLGDIVPSTNVNSRGMGGISSAYSDFLSINFNIEKLTSRSDLNYWYLFVPVTRMCLADRIISNFMLLWMGLQ